MIFGGLLLSTQTNTGEPLSPTPPAPPALADAGEAGWRFSRYLKQGPLGNNLYPARLEGAHHFAVLAREVNSNDLREFACTY